jgi:chromosome segregation ATPase
MEYEQDIKKLESNVERLLGTLDTTQDDRRKLKADIARLETTRKELEEQVKTLKEEKRVIHQRVSALIASIEKWEKAAISEEGQAPAAAVAGKGPEAVQGVLLGN